MPTEKTFDSSAIKGEESKVGGVIGSRLNRVFWKFPQKSLTIFRSDMVPETDLNGSLQI